MIFDVTRQSGLISVGPLYISYSFVEDPGYISIGSENWGLEFGDIDQDQPGIHFTTYEAGDIVETKTLFAWPF